MLSLSTDCSDEMTDLAHLVNDPPPRSILCLGPVGLDLFIDGYAPRDPLILESWAGPAKIDALAAGSSGYTAMACHGLGHTVRLVSSVGDDVFGRHVLSQLETHGLDVGEIEIARGQTGVAVYLRIFGDAKRPMLFQAADFPPWPTRFPLSTETGPDALVISGSLHYPEYASVHLLPVLAECKTKGITTFLDPQFSHSDLTPAQRSSFISLLGLVDVLCCDEREGGQLFGSEDANYIIDAAKKAGCSTIAVKREHLGAVIGDGNRLLYQPAVSLGGPRGSAAGSGDAFMAGLIDGLRRTDEIEDASRWATSVAATAILNPQGVRGISREMVAEMTARVPRAQRI